jgi:hypothetical protein
MSSTNTAAVRFKGIAVGLLSFASAADGSDALSPGYVSNLSYRAGYVMFSIIGSNGTNACSACPTDPGSMSAQNCWIAQSQTAELSILLLASAQGKMVSGRVNAFATDCTVYQLNVQN